MICLLLHLNIFHHFIPKCSCKAILFIVSSLLQLYLKGDLKLVQVQVEEDQLQNEHEDLLVGIADAVEGKG